MRKLFHILAWGTLVANIASLLVAIFWLSFPYQVTSLKEPIKILNNNKSITIGDKIEMEIAYSKPKSILPASTVFITCNDGNLVTLNSMVKNLPVGEKVFVNDDYTLPPKVAPFSFCTFHFRNTYKVNPIREIIKEWVSEEFKVLPKGDIV